MHRRGADGRHIRRPAVPFYADYISLETDADVVCSRSPLLIPGLLQSAAYGRETIAGITTRRSAEEVTALAEVRMARQSMLSRPGAPLEFWASSTR
ncbi:Scr1 family TA system antitoxin-like transcriptional regulator [Streptomyces sp. NPDC023838]|uniref:Scr1 family TA system antitoxin-like transcriptional regulator n=1 Tax=Streptomyces sp. NPDC023838 TaxID=3154325 RepID=UPI0033F78A15